MRLVKFPEVKDSNGVYIYPDSNHLFTNVVFEDGFGYGEYVGADTSIETYTGIWPLLSQRGKAVYDKVSFARKLRDVIGAEATVAFLDSTDANIRLIVKMLDYGSGMDFRDDKVLTDFKLLNLPQNVEDAIVYNL